MTSGLPRQPVDRPKTRGQRLEWQLPRVTTFPFNLTKQKDTQWLEKLVATAAKVAEERAQSPRLP